EAPPPPSLRASGRGAANHDAAQRPLDRGFQGALPHARRDLLLPADDRRPAHPLPPGVPRPALDQGPRRAPDLRPPLSRVWPAPRDSHRQRRALRHDWYSRALATQRVVAAPGHSAPTHPPSLASPERRPRTHAQDPEGRSDSPTPDRASQPSNGPSRSSAASTMKSARTRPSAGGLPPRSTGPHPASTRAPCHPSSTPGTSSSS